MAKIDVLNVEGKKVDSIEIADSIFAIEPNKQALFDAIVMQRASLRQGTHAVKNRSAVRGGGAKPWRQKGTGRARQGTIRAPQWRGGGVVFGPTPRSYGYKINKKVRRLALLSALAVKFQEGKLIVVDNFDLDAPKTKYMVSALNNLEATRKPLIVTSDANENVFKSTRNIEGALNLEVTGLNVLDITSAHSLIITRDAMTKLEEVFA
ncbi:50S ribosomal protein L4 [Mollicutes bacterium LVI A0039]|nr:50S ribosomal protein L4 [Mollicutes bacterium LVI A0039]